MPTTHVRDQFAPQYVDGVPGESTGTPACPICASSIRPFCIKQAYGREWPIARCTRCGHGFVVVRPTPEQLKPIYEQWEVDPTVGVTRATLERSADAADFSRRVTALAPPAGKALDVGAGGGVFSFHLAMRGWAPLMIDWDARNAKLTSLIPNSSFRACGIDDLSLQDGPFNVIVMSQVLEHAIDPLDWLRRAHALLAPDGLLAIALPNFAGVFSILGQRDPFLIPPQHLNFFTPRSMRVALEKSGYGALSIASRSRVTLSPPGRALSFKSRVTRQAWNTMSSVLDPTPWGIMLWAFCRKGAVFKILERSGL